MNVLGRPKKRTYLDELDNEPMNERELLEVVSIYADDTVIDDYIEYNRTLHMNEWRQYMAEWESEMQ